MSQLLLFILPVLAAAALSYALAPFASRLANYLGAIDLPGGRKIHLRVVPRFGGVAVVASIVIVLVATPLVSGGRWQLPVHLLWPLLFGVLPVLLVSLVDDVTPVEARKKFFAHLGGASIAVLLGVSLGPVVHLFGTPIHIGLLAIPISVLWIVGVTNAFNIIDGLDGLSAGLALISAVSMAGVFMLVGDPRMGGVVLVLAGALVGFLPYNFHPARMFLGDTGATAIGFCLAVFALKGGSTLSTGFAVLVPVFILGLPIADALTTISRRLLGRLERRTGGVFVADRNHIHHRLIASGIDHGRAVLILYGAGFLLAAAAFVSVFLNTRHAGQFVVALILAVAVGVHRLGYDEFAFVRRGTVLRMYDFPVVKRGMFVVFVDIFLAAVSAYLAVGLKSDRWNLSVGGHAVMELATTFAPVTALTFWWTGMYRGGWKAAGLQDLTRCVKSVLIATAIGAALVRIQTGDEHPISLLVVYGLLSLLMTASLRVSYVVLEGMRRRASHDGQPVLVYGAGARGVSAVRELFQNEEAGLRPIGFIDDDARMRGKLVTGLPVFGTGRDLGDIVRAHGAGAVLIATTLPEERVKRAAETCAGLGVGIFQMNVTVERLGPAPLEKAGRSLAPAPAGLVSAPVVPTLRLGSCHSCPSCSAPSLHRSKSRNLYERFRKSHSTDRLFRCHQCGWRGWLRPIDVLLNPIAEQAAEIDLTTVDAAMPEPLTTRRGGGN
jgi:UDP-GlcNAc:undecaprenyl-phosphate GlcNAc-1-phosphate transferase